MRFGNKGKLSSLYVGTSEIWQRVESLAYELKLPIEFALVHPVFHVSILKMFIGDRMCIPPLEGLGINVNHSNEVHPIEIFDRQAKRLRNMEVFSVMILWRNHLVETATWEAEVDIMYHYPYFFPSTPI